MDKKIWAGRDKPTIPSMWKDMKGRERGSHDSETRKFLELPTGLQKKSGGFLLGRSSSRHPKAGRVITTEAE